MSVTTRRSCIAVVSPLSLVADAVSSALGGHGYDVVTAPWPDARRRRGSSVVLTDLTADAGLLMCDLTPAPRLREARQCVAVAPLPWLLLTGSPEGPLWGAMLDAGVHGILPSSASLTEVVDAIDHLLGGDPLVEERERDAWIEEWHVSRSKKSGLVERVQSLTPRERTVLRMLYAGDGVGAIAEALEVSPATVRSHVKSVLHKFRVNSQLDAVAVLGWLRDDPESLESMDTWVSA